MHEAEEDTNASHLWLATFPLRERAFSALETYQDCVAYINFLLGTISMLYCTEGGIFFPCPSATSICPGNSAIAGQ